MRAYRSGEGAFPERAALNQLGGVFLTDFYLMVARWAQWATTVVETWPDDPREATIDLDAQDQALRRAEITETIGLETPQRDEAAEPWTSRR